MTKMVAKQIKPGYEKRIDLCVANPEWLGHIPHVEFYKKFLRLSQNQIYIVPTRNMVCNIGVSGNATHSADDVRKLPKVTRRLFNARIYEYQFPLRHPEFVIRDLYYEKSIITCWRGIIQF